MKIRIVAGGPEPLIPDLKNYNNSASDLWIGVDRGTFVLVQKGIMPDYAFGDFDSVTSAEKEIIKKADIRLNQYQSEKDHTDLELALQWAVDQNPEEILLFGATGGRLDHEMMNIQLLYRTISSNIDVKVIDIKNEISLKSPGTYKIEREKPYSYISFLAFQGEVKGITLKGFKYPLEKASLGVGRSLCISNELVNKSGTYSFDSGIILMVKSHD
ncbi:thiamine diphosphokinase [Fictibacillus phosphorivorans]|uniref:thiamine diphosphokinase n=1 Tax=Fictibacillus phosphorivorans TaxID=1221500 RepID=UPI00203B556C|nr:thiamine diphosphokinase [Fictibacillus phosphorivorans]MCM3717204.1 thiamine diphosphokinase [Fictibacillus phosphorivorans]MCM3774891.1 thiamine diphosphokinase [Fictibacillus phosphorivorans]